MTQLTLNTDPPFVYFTRCARCGVIIDAILENEAATTRPLNEAFLWGAVAKAGHICEEAKMDDVCACDHVLDEHEDTALAPCTVEDCPCKAYEANPIDEGD